MSEVHHRYDRTAVSGQITQPPFTELVDRSRRRAHHIRNTRLAIVAAFLVLTPGVLLALPGGNAPNSPVALPTTSPPAWNAFEITVEFFDIRYGVAQYPGQSCGGGWISVTQDGGKTWSKLRALPRIPDPSNQPEDGSDGDAGCVRTAVVLAAPDTLVIPVTYPQSGPDGGSAFISHDSGQSWQMYQPRVRAAVSVPDGIVPQWRCDERPCKEEGLGWYDPGAGDWMVLRNQPPWVELVGVSVAFDGSMWVLGSGRDGSGEFQLAVSRDRGRSWVDRTPTVDIDWLAHAGLVTAYDGNTAYLFPMSDTAKSDPFSLYRTTDGGKTWHPQMAAQQFKDVVFVWANRQGGLSVADLKRNQYLTTDGGNSFAPTTMPVWGASPITGGLQGWPIDVAAADPVDLYLSEDGLSWQPVEIPYYQRSQCRVGSTEILPESFVACGSARRR
ncbi:hypothetical protein Ais01nite_74140 [Asanoa ishikariensis]|uniref:BNR repeat-like domain-containing protein n=1 Tax=Asanoa ishikariensis TaxID=137265 RepID=A0A1H3URP8_9ACTN|nr:sialidase family protein [Asanoa ishikariensis]GIF69379.1 hypothetical protein Ais01nite_74140 [Asanoa ishikariensis]SDZ65140.1 BNR repeat-like domain-containing protein [Asanoa ishikariensis]